MDYENVHKLLSHSRWLAVMGSAWRDNHIDRSDIEDEEICGFGTWLQAMEPHDLGCSDIFSELKQAHRTLHAQCAESIIRETPVDTSKLSAPLNMLLERYLTSIKIKRCVKSCLPIIEKAKIHICSNNLKFSKLLLARLPCIFCVYEGNCSHLNGLRLFDLHPEGGERF